MDGIEAILRDLELLRPVAFRATSRWSLDPGVEFLVVPLRLAPETIVNYALFDAAQRHRTLSWRPAPRTDRKSRGLRIVNRGPLDVYVRQGSAFSNIGEIYRAYAQYLTALVPPIPPVTSTEEDDLAWQSIRQHEVYEAQLDLLLPARFDTVLETPHVDLAMHPPVCGTPFLIHNQAVGALKSALQRWAGRTNGWIIFEEDVPSYIALYGHAQSFDEDAELTLPASQRLLSFDPDSVVTLPLTRAHEKRTLAQGREVIADIGREAWQPIDERRKEPGWLYVCKKRKYGICLLRNEQLIALRFDCFDGQKRANLLLKDIDEINNRQS